jgi:uncharacterized membrane protein
MPVIMIIALIFLVMVQFQLFEIAFIKLGLEPTTSALILISSLLGSIINIPLFSLKTHTDSDLPPAKLTGLLARIVKNQHPDRVIVAINLGGCIIPVGLCFYFLSLQLLSYSDIGIGLLLITLISYKLSQPVPGVGIGMPVLIAPFSATIIALTLDHAHAAQLAYVTGVLGVLMGADILNINKVRALNTPLASIGGAGTFDGIFLTGILAALLA